MTSAHTYAAALVRSLEDKSPDQVEVHLGNLEALLKRRGKDNLLPRIAKHLEKMLKDAECTGTLTLALSTEADHEKLKKEIDTVAAQIAPEEERLIATEVDERLVGGFRLQSRNALYDNTHKKHLLQLFDTLISNH